MDISNETIESLHQKLKDKELTVSDVVSYFKKNIDAKNKEINAYLEVYGDLDEQVARAQKMFDEGNATLLTGIPIALKDNILNEGKIASAGSKILENYKAPYSATVVKKLKEAGAILIGRTNMDEFAMGSSTENSAFGVTKNPYDSSRVSGGSSGGSVVAVAMDGAFGALGSDTGGSIRQPANFCGVVGLKPTYGSVSRSGLMAMASSFDVIGPITKKVADSKIIFDFIKGIDPLDSTTVEGSLDNKVKRVGVPYNFLKEGIDAEVLEIFNKKIEDLKNEGYEIVDIDIRGIEESLAIYYILVPAEVSSNMARYDGVKFGKREEGENLLDVYQKTRGRNIGDEVKRRIMIGAYVLSAGYADEFYRRASSVRATMKNYCKELFKEVDIIVMPVTPTPAFPIGEKAGDPLSMYLNDIFTVYANVVGIPAISVPAGFVKRDSKDLPVGIQILANHFGEEKLFEIGSKFEKI